jgi:prolipoprotein diacylglyceryl transferase
MTAVLASIPSPSENHWGPFHFYGLMIALGVFVAVEVSARRWHDRGGDPDDMWAIALWAVPAGLIGARIYHLITDWRTYIPGNVSGMIKVWDGGLGIPGGIIAGVGVGLYVGHRRGMRLPVGLDAVAPGMAFAQAIGRWGNWFNQELYGRPTSLPWGLEIDPAHRSLQFLHDSTFQPTFLYESLWNVALAFGLILLDRRRVVRPGRIFALYIGGYAFGRFFVEALRSDHASEILGIRVNSWVASITFLGVVVFLLITGLRRRPGDSDEPYVDGHRFGDESAPSGEPAADEADGEADGKADDRADAESAEDAPADEDVEAGADRVDESASEQGS